MSGIPCSHAISCIKFKGIDLESFVDGYYKKEVYLRCYKSVIHPLNGLDLWERTTHPDVMLSPYRRPSHRPMKKRRPTVGDEEQSSHTHLSRKGEKQRCSICGSVGHNKCRCPKPVEDLHSKKVSNKGKQQKGSTKSQPPAAEGGRKIASFQPIPKLVVNRKAALATQPLSSTQSNNAAQPKRPRGRPKGTTKPNCSTKHDPQPKKLVSPISSAPPSSSSQPTTKTLPLSQPTLVTSRGGNGVGRGGFLLYPTPPRRTTIRIETAPLLPAGSKTLNPNPSLRGWGGYPRVLVVLSPLATSSSQPVGHFSARLFGAPHVSPKKLKLMAKLPLRKWELL
ncbi:hypothetical protein Ahy_B06g084923 [Arachis hypogaea]|uniref:Zinc finger PMZ-type domain-containing protein n=1 Tax=Arachis hypogaea TaxID=3818 RepID=A0A444YT15_ARAHY|nr:hypothetical protein Ahy_B06g084923 [Arachis hypogaea]